MSIGRIFFKKKILPILIAFVVKRFTTKAMSMGRIFFDIIGN